MMAGFPGRRVIVLEFDSAMAGAEVTLRAASVETMLAVREATVQEAVPLLAENLISWNLTGSDGEVIAFEEKHILREVEPTILMKIIGEWYKVAVGISAPLDLPSNNGPPKQDTAVEELSIPMEVLSSHP